MAKRHMQQIWHHILNGLCTVLQQDTKIRPGAFNAQFTVEKFADVLFSLMLSAFAAAGLRPRRCAGDRAQDHLLSKKHPTSLVGVF